jgi:hypothetical protein
MKRALVVGIDDYRKYPLRGCVNDAIVVGGLLEANGDGSPNFSVRMLTSNEEEVTTELIQDALSELFEGDAETVLFYFAGHGLINVESNAGYIVSQDGKKGSWGVSLSEVLAMANKAYPLIKSTVIILDSCHSGYAGEVAGLTADGASLIGNGVTILTATNRSGTADEIGGHGVFSEILIDAIQGGSADICGRITPASVYAHVDQTLGAWGQRPVYKANVHTFVVLRSVEPKVPLQSLRRLPEYFPDRTSTYPLDPSCEPNRGQETERLADVAVDVSKERVYRELQTCNRHGLVSPVGYDHMWEAAINSTGCRLTALGAHYRQLAEKKRIL